jgi:anti-sigma B factor antagonist
LAPTSLIGSCRSLLAVAPTVDNHFSVDVRREREAAIVVPAGEVDLASAPELQAGLERAWQSDAELVIIDLRDVQFMDSTGLHVIVNAHQRAQKADRQFGVVDGGEQVHKLLSLTGVFDTLNVGAAPDELLH